MGFYAVLILLVGYYLCLAVAPNDHTSSHRSKRREREGMAEKESSSYKRDEKKHRIGDSIQRCSPTRKMSNEQATSTSNDESRTEGSTCSSPIGRRMSIDTGNKGRRIPAPKFAREMSNEQATSTSKFNDGSRSERCTCSSPSDICKSTAGEPILEAAIKVMPQANGKDLNFYALPVGQGDAQVLQCPTGEITIIDLGSSSAKDKRFWAEREIKNFLLGHEHRIVNIVITHDDSDHYSFFDKVFSNPGELSGLEKIYISCTREDMGNSLGKWIDTLDKPKNSKVQMFNDGKVCGSSDPNKQPCNEMILCPRNSGIKVKVLSANAGGCKKGHSNEDSIVMNITFTRFSMQLNGDFQGVRHLDNMITCYKDNLKVTVYKLAHHGAVSSANTNKMCNAVKPKAVFVSSDPWHGYNHPRCTLTDYFINMKEDHLCKPEVTDENDKFYCGEHPISDQVLPPENRPQKEFACGCVHDETTNEFAIYSTTPSRRTINLVRLVTDGTKWGFVNNIQTRFPEK